MTNKIFGKVIVNVAGTTFEGRQGKLWNLRKAENAGKTCYLTLRREENNERDANAIAVIAHVEDENKKTAFKVGYVPANVAGWLAKRMDAGMIVRAYRAEKDAKFVHGNKGVNLGIAMKIVYEVAAKETAVVEAEA